ncbi:unnamed protein product [Urochloa humidicola]
MNQDIIQYPPIDAITKKEHSATRVIFITLPILPRKRPGNTIPGLISELLTTPNANQSLQFKVTNSRRREQKICIAVPTFYGLPPAPGGSGQLRR